MFPLKRIYDFILFGNIYVAIGAVCLIQSSIIQLGGDGHLFFYSVLTFFATLFIYNLQRIFYLPQKDNSFQSVRRKWIFENQFTIKLLCLIGLIGASIFFFFNDFKILFFLSPLLLLSVAYFLPFIKLRQNAWLKLLTLATVWSMTTALLPAFLMHIDIFSAKNMLHFSVRLCFMIGICIPFDIRDNEIDKAENISTLTHIFGENKTRWLAALLVLANFILIIIEYYRGMLNVNIFIALSATAFVSGFLVWMSNSKRSEYFFVAGIDGTMILQGIVLLFVNYL